MKIKNLIMVTATIVVIFLFSSCSEGTFIPQPVCEYGTDICQTLTYLCTLNVANQLDSTQVLELQTKLAEIDKEVQKLRVETIAKVNSE